MLILLFIESFPDVMRISIHSKRVLLRLSEGTPAGGDRRLGGSGHWHTETEACCHF